MFSYRLSLVFFACWLTALVAADAALADTISEMTLSDNTWQYWTQGLNAVGARTDGSSGGRPGRYRYGPGPDEPDHHLLQFWWWYRGDADTREYGLSNQVSGSVTAGQATLQYLEPVSDGTEAGALQFDLTYTLTGGTAQGPGTFRDMGSATLVIDWEITNLLARSQTVDFFNYLDVELIGDGSNDQSRLEEYSSLGGWTKVWDGATAPEEDSTDGLNFAASPGGLTGWQSQAYSGVKDLLIDASVSNLTDATTPFGPGDFTGAFQWQFVLDASESVCGRSEISINSIVIPEPGTLGMLLIGCFALFKRKTSKRRSAE